MNSQRIYERKVKGLDTSVWLFMFIIMLLSLVLLTSFLVERKKCIPFTFKITPQADSGGYYTEKNLSFTLSTSAKKVTWNFGDGTPEKTGVFVSHEYHKAGKFYVTASIKDGCDETQEITVNKSLLDHSTGSEVEGPESIAVEKDAEFSCTVYGSSWKWEVMDHPEIKSKTEKLGTAKFRFANAGTYYVQVTLDDDRTKSFRKEIVITDDRVKRKTTDINDIKPIFTDQRGGPKKEEKTATEEPQINITQISPRSLKDKLTDVIADDNSSPSLEYFNQFLDDGAATTVKIEGTNSSMTFNKFYTHLKKNGNLKIADVKISRSPEKKVQFIIVTFSN
jgi:hypothetical protein